MTVLTAYLPLAPFKPTAYFTSLVSLLNNNPAEVKNLNELKVAAGSFIEVDIHGNGLHYIGNFPYAGTINSIQVNYLGNVYYTLTNMSVNVQTLLTDISKHTNAGYAAALSLFFPGHDRIHGSVAGSDNLPDFNGHDKIYVNGPNDTASGGGGADNFYFHAGFTNATINHFIAGTGANHDTIDVHSPISSLHVSSLGGNNFQVSDGIGDTITLFGVKGHLNIHDFHFLA
jgi:hypothetical protein